MLHSIFFVPAAASSFFQLCFSLFFFLQRSHSKRARIYYSVCVEMHFGNVEQRLSQTNRALYLGELRNRYTADCTIGKYLKVLGWFSSRKYSCELLRVWQWGKQRLPGNEGKFFQYRNKSYMWTRHLSIQDLIQRVLMLKILCYSLEKYRVDFIDNNVIFATNVFFTLILVPFSIIYSELFLFSFDYADFFLCFLSFQVKKINYLIENYKANPIYFSFHKAEW